MNDGTLIRASRRYYNKNRSRHRRKRHNGCLTLIIFIIILPIIFICN